MFSMHALDLLMKLRWHFSGRPAFSRICTPKFIFILSDPKDLLIPNRWKMFLQLNNVWTIKEDGQRDISKQHAPPMWPVLIMSWRSTFKENHISLPPGSIYRITGVDRVTVTSAVNYDILMPEVTQAILRHTLALPYVQACNATSQSCKVVQLIWSAHNQVELIPLRSTEVDWLDMHTSRPAVVEWLDMQISRPAVVDWLYIDMQISRPAVVDWLDMQISRPAVVDWLDMQISRPVHCCQFETSGTKCATLIMSCDSDIFWPF